MNCPGHHADDLVRPTKDQLIVLVVAMARELAEANSLILAYAQQVEEPTRSAGKNSRNSGMPPSSDGLSKPPVEEIPEKRTRSLRGKSNRDPGGQPEHQGGALRQVETPDEVVDLFPHACKRCKIRLPKGLASGGHAKRQVRGPAAAAEDPYSRVSGAFVPVPELRQDREGQVSEGHRLSRPIREAHNGLRRLSGGVQLIPPARLAEIMADMFDAQFSQAALPAMIRRTARKFRDPANSIRETLPKPI